MNAKTNFLLGAAVAVGLTVGVATPSSAQVSTTANGPYYATPSWDQKLTTGRFVVLANWGGAAVLDRETGLVWERSPDATAHNFADASFLCNNSTVGGRKGWRLPGIQELASLVDPSVAVPGPTLPAGHPFLNVVSGVYWSGSGLNSTVGVSSGAAWILNFYNGNLQVFGALSAGMFVWCVRGGQGPVSQ